MNMMMADGTVEGGKHEDCAGTKFLCSGFRKLWIWTVYEKR